MCVLILVLKSGELFFGQLWRLCIVETGKYFINTSDQNPQVSVSMMFSFLKQICCNLKYVF